MSSFLHIAVDTSGSMCELGKEALLKNLCRFLVQDASLRRKQARIRLLSWADKILPLSLGPEGSLPSFSLGGSADLQDLANFFTQQEDYEGGHVLLLSDGYFSGDIDDFLASLKKLNLVCHAVAVGADADWAGKENIDPADLIWLPEDIAALADEVWSMDKENSTAITAKPFMDDGNDDDEWD
ncbi:vWA domain-containing protein [Mailhella sp.]